MTSIAAGGRVARGIALGLCGLALGSCTDCFFRVQGHLVDCATSVPLSGATITAHVDQGMHGARTLPTTFTSDAAGLFKVTTDGTETCDVTVTVTFQKDGYTPAETQFKGAPKSDVQQCLTAAGAP
ncbi:MAG: hypothetical protein ABUR63_07865 [Verrucomicrobiota bacterium]